MTRVWSPGEIGKRIPLDTWASYENSLSEKSVVTKTIINIVIHLLGDWLSQTLFQKKNILDFDAAQTLKNGFVGMCFRPVVHEYYEFSNWISPVWALPIVPLRYSWIKLSIYRSSVPSVFLQLVYWVGTVRRTVQRMWRIVLSLSCCEFWKWYFCMVKIFFFELSAIPL